MLESGMIPPNIHFKNPNPEIQFDKWNVRVPTELTPWPTAGLRRISVNSFGYGGTNAHAVLDDAQHYLSAREHALSLKNAANGMNGAVSVNGLNTVKELNGTNGVNGVKQLNGSNGVNEVNGMNGVNEVNGMNRVATLRHSPTLNDALPRLFIWSAQDKDGLTRMKEPLATYVQAKIGQFQSHGQDAIEKKEAFMAELAHTLSERRSRLQWKTYAIASSAEELIGSLKAATDKSHAPVVQSSRQPRIGFVFTGQGAQWPRMGAELMAYGAFRESIEAADRHLQEICGCPWSAAEELLKDKDTSSMNQAGYSHALSSILQVALVDLLKTWNITPTAVVGHSGGEIAASYASGALTREDTWKIAYYRGCVAAAMKIRAPKLHGSMMAAGLSAEEAEEWISKVTDGHLVVACINSPTNTTIAGDVAGIDQLLGMLKAKGVFARKLVVDTAYHSPHMAIIADMYRELTSNISPVAAPAEGCTMYSTVTGGFIEPGQVDVDHWVVSLTSPVRFSEAIYDMVRPISGNKRADENAIDLLIEVGPHPALKGPSTQSLKAHNIINFPHHSVVTRNHNAIETAMNVAGALFTQGCPVNIREVNADGHVHFGAPLTDLPTYSWNHSQRFWHESRVEKEYLSREAPKPGLLGSTMPSVAAGERLWKGFIRLSEASWIADHKIQGSTLYPGAGYIVMALEAAIQTADTTRQIACFQLRDIQFTAAAIIASGADLEYIVQLRPHVAGTRDLASTWTEFRVTTSPDGKALVQNCCGLLLIEYEVDEGTDASRERRLEQQALKTQYMEAQEACANRLDTDGFYADMRSWGLEYGPTFTNVCEAHNREGQSVGAVRIPEDSQIPTRRPKVIHPATLDAVFHLAFAAVKIGSYSPSTAMVPKFIDSVVISANIPLQTDTRLPGFSNASKHGLNELNADIVMLDNHEQFPAVVIEGLLCAEIAGASSSSTKSITSKLTWKPAVDLLSPDELCSLLSGHTGEDKLIEVCD